MDEGTRALLQAHLEKARQKQEAAAARETSDYEAVSWVNEEVADKAIREAGEFCDAIETYLAKLGIVRGDR